MKPDGLLSLINSIHSGSTWNILTRLSANRLIIKPSPFVLFRFTDSASAFPPIPLIHFMLEVLLPTFISIPDIYNALRLYACAYALSKLLLPTLRANLRLALSTKSYIPPYNLIARLYANGPDPPLIPITHLYSPDSCLNLRPSI